VAIAALPVSVGGAEDIAPIALFLASDEERMITGAIIPADGGLSAYQGAWRLQDLADAAIRSLLDLGVGGK